jgi:hypothetical protein
MISRHSSSGLTEAEVQALIDASADTRDLAVPDPFISGYHLYKLSMPDLINVDIPAQGSINQKIQAIVWTRRVPTQTNDMWPAIYLASLHIYGKLRVLNNTPDASVILACFITLDGPPVVGEVPALLGRYQQKQNIQQYGNDPLIGAVNDARFGVQLDNNVYPQVVSQEVYLSVVVMAHNNTAINQVMTVQNVKFGALIGL